MGIDVSAGDYRFIDDGTDVSSIFRSDLGWWRMDAMGWFPYTDLRDVHAHERTGLGRPWLYKLPTKWQDLIFRELILLVVATNQLMDAEPLAWFEMGPVQDDIPMPEWMKYWLTLTNESWRLGLQLLTQDVLGAREWYGDLEADATVEQVTTLWNRSETTWRPMMPARAEYHRKYSGRDAYWSFER